MKVRFTATAAAETSEILARIARDNPQAALAVASAIKLAVGRLVSFPRIGVETDQPGIYVKLARPYRYLIFYRIGHDTVVVRNVRHPARLRLRNH